MALAADREQKGGMSYYYAHDRERNVQTAPPVKLSDKDVAGGCPVSAARHTRSSDACKN